MFQPRLVSHTLAVLDVVTTWSGSVSPLSPHLFPIVFLLAHALAGLTARVSSRACLAERCHETLAAAGLDAVARWSGLVSFFVGVFPACFHMFSHLFLTCLLGWVLSRGRSSRACLLPHALAGLDAVTTWSGAGRCHKIVWLFVSLFPSVSPLVSSPCLFPHALALDCLARSALTR